MATGVLLINLGTPESTATIDVKRYLRQFLIDERVIDIPYLARWILVNCLIAPTRAKSSAKAYQQIWTKQGSPLLIHGQQLANKVQLQLGQNYRVKLGMRYGKPSIDSALKQLNRCDKIIILPLYPQYSSAATGSSIQYCLDIINKWQNIPSLNIISQFYDHTDFIQAQSQLIKQNIDEHDFILFSYHGLPERQLHKSGCKQICSPCEEKTNNPQCYRYQCYQTTRKLIEDLNIDKDKTTTSFQSRLGKTPWIKPYTDEVLSELATKGIKHLAIVCPSFVADCLETLEEIGIQARQQWQQLGGESFKLIPCVNSCDAWAHGIKQLVLESVESE